MTKDFSITRRHLLQGTGALAALSVIGVGPAFAATGPVRFGIYGSATKLATRGKAVARYQELHPEVQVVFEGVPSDAWPDKIAEMDARRAKVLAEWKKSLQATVQLAGDPTRRIEAAQKFAELQTELKALTEARPASDPNQQQEEQECLAYVALLVQQFGSGR